MALALLRPNLGIAIASSKSNINITKVLRKVLISNQKLVFLYIFRTLFQNTFWPIIKSINVRNLFKKEN